MQIIYNLEKFAIEHLFRPYANMIIDDLNVKNIPSFIPEKDTCVSIERQVYACIHGIHEKAIQKDLGYAIILLEYHPDFADKIFGRLREIQASNKRMVFYKHLVHDIIPYVEWRWN